jgi:hypothetical protein
VARITLTSKRGDKSAQYPASYDGNLENLQGTFLNADANFTELYTGDIRGYGIKGDGVTDDTAALNAALAANAGGTLTIPLGMRVLVDSGNIIVPDRTTLAGPHKSTGQPIPHTQATYDTTLTGVIILNSAYTIVLGSNTGTGASSAAIKGLYIIRKGLLIPVSAGDCDTVLAAYAGTAITLGNGTQNKGGDTYVGDCMILGFAQSRGHITAVDTPSSGCWATARQGYTPRARLIFRALGIAISGPL